MALTKSEIKATYPLALYNYRVSISDMLDTASISFAEVSGLAMEYEPVVYKHGLSFLMGDSLIAGMQQPVKITFRKGVVQGGRYLYDWIHKSHHQPYFLSDRRDVLIDLCDESGVAMVRWVVSKALPIKLEAPGFDVNSSDVAIESMELQASTIKVEYF
jgi:phage tail-like protein